LGVRRRHGCAQGFHDRANVRDQPHVSRAAGPPRMRDIFRDGVPVPDKAAHAAQRQ